MRLVGTFKGSVLTVLAANVLAGCGGGGGGYGSSSPMPSITFTAPMQATSINFGQAVHLAWTSNYATSCTASTSSTMGGSFSGTQPLNGSATVAPTGAGSVTYTLTCMGTGGMASATTATITVNPSILSTLAPSKITTIGSVTTTTNPGTNPYGLAIAPATSGLITKGDLIACNFNNTTPTQGSGNTIVGLHPTAGATPYAIAADAKLLGCDALTMLPDDSISAAAYGANASPLVTSAGVVNNPFSAYTFHSPWGEAFAAANAQNMGSGYGSGTGQNTGALYVSNVDGSIDRITLNGDTPTAFATIATGFCGSGQPGAIYAPSGLTYDASIDTLYIVDTSSFSVVAFANVSAIGAAGVVVAGQCSSASSPPTPMPTFSGPSASSARVIAH